MKSSPPANCRFLPTLTEVVQPSELAQYRSVANPQPAPFVREQSILQRLDELVTQLLSDEPDDAARAMLASKFQILRQCLHQEFNADHDPVLPPERASGS